MTNDTARILASCLDGIEQGQSLEECVAQHPDQGLILSELLPVAQMLRSAPATVPSLDFRMDARQRLLARLPARHPRPATWLTGRLMFLRVVVILLLVVVLATSVVTASAQALPNDVLYPVKRSIEQARLVFTLDKVGSGDLRLAFAAERLKEVERLIDIGRGADATVAIDNFADQMRSVVAIAQAMPDTIERADLIARVAASVESSSAVLSAAQARLPESAQDALARARTLLTDGASDLPHSSLAPLPAVSATPNRPSLQQRTPTSSLSARPLPRVTSAPPVNPAYVFPHWPTPTAHWTWPGHHR